MTFRSWMIASTLWTPLIRITESHSFISRMDCPKSGSRNRQDRVFEQILRGLIFDNRSFGVHAIGFHVSKTPQMLSRIIRYVKWGPMVPRLPEKARE